MPSTIAIATPAYGGQVTAHYTHSLLYTSSALGDRGMPLYPLITDGDSLVPRARNRLVAQFLAYEPASHLVFIDADIQWVAEDFLRLLDHDIDVVCGAYSVKCYPLVLPVHPLPDEYGKLKRNAATGLIGLARTPTGFLCIKRQVFERLILSGAVDRITRGAEGVPDEAKQFYYDFFPVGVHDGVYYPEDYGFSRVWTSIGGEIWLDPLIQLGHVGMHVYRGDPASVFAEEGAAGGQERPSGSV